MDDFERQILGTAAKIKTAEVSAKRLANALDAKAYMVRWTINAAPGLSTSDSIDLTVEDVEDLIRQKMLTQVENDDKDAKDAVRDLINACQPGANDC